jgi:hypothetical protein
MSETALRSIHVVVSSKFSGVCDRIEPLLDEAPNWLRYSLNTWLLRTAKSPRYWYDRLKATLGESEYLLVMEVDLNTCVGWLPEGVWDWIDQEAASDRNQSLAAAE